MATTKKASSKKTAARKPATKAAPKATTVKSETKKASFELPELPDMDEFNERFDDMMADAVKFMRDATHTYVGMGLVVQDRLTRREFPTISYSAFMDEAKAKGETRMHELQDRFEPYIQRVTDRVEPVAERVEARLPEQVKEVIETGRKRVRHVLAA